VTVVAFVPDQMDRSRFPAGVVFVARIGDLADAAADVDLVVVDLSRPGALEVVGAVAVRVVGFAPHVDRELIDRAAHAGCDDVLPRSAFFARIAEIITA
jgi:hypothetical protein